MANGGVNYYLYDEQGHLIGEYSSTGAVVNETVWFGDTPVAVRTGTAGATVSSVSADWLNAPHIIQNASKQAVWTWDHLAFGDNAPNQNPSALGVYTYNHRFPGQYADAETGLFYNIMRDYNSAIGRYIQSDPIGLNGGINTYGYVGGNPLNMFDPNGMANKSIDLGEKYTGRFDYYKGSGGQAMFEIHVFDKSTNPVGIYGPSGWINRHGFKGAPNVPECVSNNLNQLADDWMARAGLAKSGGKILRAWGGLLIFLDFMETVSTAEKYGIDPWELYLYEMGVLSGPDFI